ncbi:hypothetical protein CLAFUW4_14205 [Fulvia fulva]|uniref:Uncharacterized protein n=1 Tax=Passalora fulva TaxID=5499 RepID=A0A9Q8PLP5_PASFU|nr:uncharacterized protein CLAFUR5_14038 [Fulvia fulva]KAK4610106.1 hypothetical protein CLAFUR4_14208 [Fulvia fulva]KAK4610836.1 hypothetical protein CLAFUR0_14213 [Fulvia fulva]UJO24736.1 hypothetical protein CLAFUR5_14038 [Fulvia fulva]WPV21726.1 hypothetical protein CLAFUW4_14205 [Fulvia fulva]WPV36961.1 hypothetical protein CLAFUW7_14216 [Fulvia fulva]
MSSDKDNQTMGPKQCYFWNLPAELRLNIYEAVLGDFNIGVEDEEKCVTPPIMQVCRKIYHEAKQKYSERLSHLRSAATEGYRQAQEEFHEAVKKHLTLLNKESHDRMENSEVVYDAKLDLEVEVCDRVALEMRKMARAAGVDLDEKYHRIADGSELTSLGR